MRKMLMLSVIALFILPFFIVSASAQTPASVLIKTEHYIDAQSFSAIRIAYKTDVQISDDRVKVGLSETLAAIAGIPQWIVSPPAEQVEFRWVHGISRCGCVDGDDYANGYNDFDYAWKLRVPASRLIALEYAQACLGGDSIEVFVSTSSAGPWVKIFTVKTPSYCRYTWNPEQPYYVDLGPFGLIPNTDYWLRVYSRGTSLDLFKLAITAQEPIGVQSTTWGAIKALF